ncbi:unnamed protein product [Diatraea saccharalis]|uniref:Uncharacterized protein n=1 Tax=Diatraea saccharalis TaxID=40085 RepID=A0A9N9R612_9NEOP|nr:unnamed protein product [Diatraea saccharalis]
MRRRGASALSLLEERLAVPVSADIECKQGDMQTLIEELRLLGKEMQETRLQVQVLNETLGALGARVDVCESRLDKLTSRIENIESCGMGSVMGCDGTALANTIESLRAELNERDQELLMNDLEITCIPEQKGEGLQHGGMW